MSYTSRPSGRRPSRIGRQPSELVGRWLLGGKATGRLVTWPWLRIPSAEHGLRSQIAGLARKGLLVRGDDVLFADALYSTELGLDLTFGSQDDS